MYIDYKNVQSRLIILSLSPFVFAKSPLCKRKPVCTFVWSAFQISDSSFFPLLTLDNSKSKKVIWLTIFKGWYWRFKLDCSSECDPIPFRINPKFEFNLQSTIISNKANEKVVKKSRTQFHQPFGTQPYH